MLVILGFSPSSTSVHTDKSGAPIRSGASTLRVLTPEDAERYRQIFHAQKQGRWQEADRLIATLDNQVLTGHVRYQRYMHPTAWRATYKELSAWLSAYRDHPGAVRVYRLALHRRPARASRPATPVNHGWRGETTTPAPWETAQYQKAWRKINALLRRGRPTQALATLDRKPQSSRLTTGQTDRLRALIAGSYFIENKVGKTLTLASGIVQRAGNTIPRANWYAGLAAWRLGRITEAADFFAPLATSPQANKRMRAAGAFWAARAYKQLGDEKRAHSFLAQAAATGLTFYSLLAAHSLGDEDSVSWISPHPVADATDNLARNPGVVRAIALVEAGRPEMAEYELMNAHGRLSPSLDKAALALAHQLDLPASQVHIAQSMPADNPEPVHIQRVRTSLYPVPSFEPDGGFRLDRALVYAVIRQESRFRSRAKSGAGARGLMQILPTTAGYIARDRSLARHRRHDLYDPTLNLTLGQKYMTMLLKTSAMPNNLFMAAAAWNSGPGQVKRWLSRMDYKDDPLLFIESIPFAETRNFVKRVMTNLWVYRSRLNQPAPSLAMVATGRWPLYQPLEGKPTIQAWN